MQSNRYPITLGLALREICLVSRDIWSHYRADARLRAARRRDARIRARTYAPPSGFNEFDSFLWCATIALGLFIAVVSLMDGWGAIDAAVGAALNWIHGLFAPASTAVAASTGVVLRSRGNAISSPSLAVIQTIAEQPGISTPDILRSHPHMTHEQLRSRLNYLASAGYLASVLVQPTSGNRVRTWRVLRMPEALGGDVRTTTAQQPAATPKPEPAPKHVGPIVQPPRPDNTRPWTQPYMADAPARRGAADFRSLPSLQGTRRIAMQPKP